MGSEADYLARQAGHTYIWDIAISTWLTPGSGQGDRTFQRRRPNHSVGQTQHTYTGHRESSPGHRQSCSPRLPTMVVLYDKPVPALPVRPSTPTPSSHPPPAQLLELPLQAPAAHHPPQPPPRPPNQPHPVPPGIPPALRVPRRPIPRPIKAPPSKINLLDLPTETTATIFRLAHKPRDFHFLLPSGAGPLRTRKYNLPLTVSKEWYRRVRPLYYERLRLNWLRIPDFVENVQRYDVARFVQRVDVRVQGSAFYRAIQGRGGEGPGGKVISNAQMKFLVLQYVDLPLMTFGLVLDSLPCIKELTLRFSDCKGDEVSMQCTLPPLLNLFFVHVPASLHYGCLSV